MTSALDEGVGDDTASDAGPPAPDALLGRVVGGRYRVQRELGDGGMGTVYEVLHLSLGKTFALKKLSPEWAHDAEALARFRREAEVVARLGDTHAVQITDWETLDDGTPAAEALRDALGADAPPWNERLDGKDKEQRDQEAQPMDFSRKV